VLLWWYSWLSRSAARPVRTRSGEDAKPYTESIPGTDIKFDLVPIPGGTFTMGSPDGEAKRGDDEGPQHDVEIKPFFMGKCEVTWDEFDIYSFQRDLKKNDAGVVIPSAQPAADGVTRPTPPYVEMTFGYGHDKNPAICMTHHAAMEYCRWLTAKTGKLYRLPTEAEWEYACRAGTKTKYSFGDDAAQLKDYAWSMDNSDAKPQQIGLKKPNPWGLHDMHGNVAEWCLDSYDKDAYKTLKDKKVAPFIYRSNEKYPHVARGGSWDDEADKLRSAARRGSDKSWSQQDPQLPQSIWWHTDAKFVGFRVIHPIEEHESLKGVHTTVKKEED
jgi:formylglycine-generating enzyme required for sulfatase activity